MPEIRFETVAGDELCRYGIKLVINGVPHQQTKHVLRRIRDIVREEELQCVWVNLKEVRFLFKTEAARFKFLAMAEFQGRNPQEFQL